MQPQNYELHFAPLQGYTDHVFRNAFARYFGGIDVYYTPFIRIEKGGFRNRDLREIVWENNKDICLVPQILPGSADEFRLLADLLQGKEYRKVDINLGCPFPLIAGKRKGAGMLPYPDQVREVLEMTEEYPDMQFSVKMRLGWEKADDCMRLVDILNSLRLHHITLHARTGKQQYKGNTDREAFARFYESVKHPLFYNGDIGSLEDISGVLGEFPLLKGIAIGRGLVSSPGMAREFKTGERLSPERARSLCLDFHKELFETYSKTFQGETQILLKMKTLWEYFLPETDRKLLKRIKKASKLKQYTEAVQEIFTI